MAASLGYVLSQLQRWTSPHLAELSDAVLLERFVQRRDESAFAALVARHGAMVLRSCRRILGDGHQAEDAFQAAFLILARRAHSLRQPAALPGFLHSIARRVALKARNKSAARSAETPLADELFDPHPDPLTQLTARELLDIFDVEIAHLPPPQRSAVVLCCLEGNTREEAARILGCTLGSLKGHLERGRQRLQERLKRRGVALSAALAVVAVSRGEAATASLLRNTVAVVLGGGIGNSAVELAHSALKTMLWGKLSAAMGVVLTVALAACATVAVVYHSSAEEDPDDKPSVAAAPKALGEGKPQARTDALGDPLPEGAIARLGTVRFRHGEHINRMLFMPDGKHLISNGSDGVRVWDTATGKELRRLLPPPGENWGQATDLSSDGEQLAVVHGSDCPIDIWNIRRGKKIDSFGRGDYSSVRFSPDGKLVAVCSKLSGVELWDVARGEKLRSWKAHKWQIWFFVFTADSRRLLTIGTEGTQRLWDAATGRQIQEFPIANYSIQSLNSLPLSPDGSLLAVIEDDKPPELGGMIRPRARISVWDTATGKRLQQLNKGPFESEILSLTFTADGKRLLSSGPGSFIRIWDPRTGKELRKIPFGPRGGHVLALSKDGKTLAAASGMSIHLLDLPSGKPYQPPEGHVVAMAISYFSQLTPDGRMAVTDSWENALLVWDAATGQVRQKLEKHNDYYATLHLSRDGKTLFSHGYYNVLRRWDLSRGEERSQVHLNFSRGMAFNDIIVSPDNRSLFLEDAQGIIHQLDAGTGKERSHYQGPKFLWGMACRPDGRSLVGWSGDRKIRIWDAANGRLQHEYTVPKEIMCRLVMAANLGEGSYYSAALSPDGRLLAMGSSRATNAPKQKQQYALIFKELSTGRDIIYCDPLPSAPEVLVFSPDGRMLAWSGGFGDPAVHLLEAASGRERRLLVGHRGRVHVLNFSATGERLLSASLDTTALIWDLGCGRARSRPTAAELEALWSDLAGQDAARAYLAIQRLAAAPDASVPFLRKHLQPAPAVDETYLTRLIAELDSDDFTKRERATAELQELGEQALPAYRKALESKPSLESRRRLEDLLDKAQRAWWGVSGERLRFLRAVEALEWANTKESRDVLGTLSGGAAGTRRTQEAKAALERLANGRR